MALNLNFVSHEQKHEHIKELAARSAKLIEKQNARSETRKVWSTPRKCLYDIINTNKFEAVCGGVILINMVLVIVETDATVNDGQPPFWAVVLTNMLLMLYSIELTTKLYVYRLEFFRDTWNVLDFLIVGVDLMFLLISAIVDKLPSFSILRVFRLVRLARAFKAAKSFKELHLLLRACTCAFKAIFWGMVLICMTFTIWGILCVQFIHPINAEIVRKRPYVYAGCERCPRSFETVFDSVLTLWKQLVAGDSWGTLCEPIIEEAPWTFLFFMVVLVSINLLMLNCILAVVVEAGANASAQDLHEKAVQQQKVVIQAEEKLVAICQGLDSDGSGSVSKQEFFNGFRENADFRECLEVMHVTESDMDMIFNICDEDDSGDVDYNEFVDQLRRIKHSGEQMLLHYVTDIRHIVNKMGHELLKTPYRDVESKEETTDVCEQESQEPFYPAEEQVLKKLDEAAASHVALIKEALCKEALDQALKEQDVRFDNTSELEGIALEVAASQVAVELSCLQTERDPDSIRFDECGRTEPYKARTMSGNCLSPQASTREDTGDWQRDGVDGTPGTGVWQPAVAMVKGGAGRSTPNSVRSNGLTGNDRLGSPRSNGQSNGQSNGHKAGVVIRTNGVTERLPMPDRRLFDK